MMRFSKRSRFIALIGIGVAIALLSCPLSIAQPAPRSATTLNPTTLKQTLDQGNINEAVQQIELGWKTQYETYYQRKMTGQLFLADQIRSVLGRNAFLTKQRSALIYAVPTSTSLELIVITADGQPIHRRVSEANQKTLKAAIAEFRENAVNIERDPEDYLPPAQKLYQLMMQPIESELQARNITNLIFCMGADLRSTPLAAMHDGQRFLSEKYSIAIIPAFSLLNQRPATLRNTRVLAMGASQFRDMQPLQEVPRELEVIAQNLWQGQKLLNQEFTIDRLRAERSKFPYGIIHLATHAAFSPGEADDSFIQFWDQRLQLTQLPGLNLRSPEVQLLVLSACQTALGDRQAELGFAGLAVQSGSQAAIASLWKADDTGTLVLMTEFYRQLRTAPSKAEALRRAQSALLKQQTRTAINLATRGNSNSATDNLVSTNLSHPYYWAAFTLIGNPW